MYLSTTTINEKTISLIFSRIITNLYPFQKYGGIAISEFNIDEISSLSNEDNCFYPTRILKDLIPFMVEIINADEVSKAVYTFTVDLKAENRNPHDIQYFRKDIEVEITSEDDRRNVEDVITELVDNMRDPRNYFVSPRYNGEDVVDVPENNKKLILTVTRMELLDEIKREKLNNIRSYKDDKCVICINTNPTVLFCDCGHTCICEDCYILLEDNKCPKCRFNNKTIRKI